MTPIQLPELPEPDTASLAMSGREVEYIDGYEAGFESARDQMQEYATKAVLAERERCADVAALYDLGTVEGHAIATAIRQGTTEKG